MRAIVHTKYGPPDELQLKEVEKPAPKDNEVLVKIHATTVITTDCNARNLTFVPKLLWLPMRMQFGFLEPKIKTLGIDLAGEIEAVGKDVERFKTGDQVFGTPEPALGTHAEYICIPEDGVLVKKPASMTYEEAATIPLAMHTALHFLKDQVRIEAGQKVLIIGASGAIGTYAVQVAKYYGAEVTGVCSTTNLEMVKSLGADNIIDYTKEDFTKNSEIYDVIFDAVSKSSYLRCKNSLTEYGTYLVSLPNLPFILQTPLASLFGNRKIKNGSRIATVEDLLFSIELFDEGRLKPVIDRSYPLEEIAEAYRYVETGHKKGSVVITVAHNGKT